MAWRLNADRPIYLQLMEQIELKIVVGEYAAGQRILSVRELAADAGVNPNTMQKALAELEIRGLISTQRTNGKTITADSEKISDLRIQLAKNEIVSFLQSMQGLGFNKEDICGLIAKHNEEEEK
ncbi:MAG: GntR family transcriptional regulator [Oscillospiraceae bacterium]